MLTVKGVAVLASIKNVYNKKGELTGYKFRICLGRNEAYRQIWRTKTIDRPEGLTPAKERKEVERLAAEWEREQMALYQAGHAMDKKKITFAEFAREHWWKDHVEDGTHTENGEEFFNYMLDGLLSYFGKRRKLSQIDVEAVKRYIKYLNVEAKTKAGKPYSEATIKHYYATLHNILEYARRLHYIDSNPCNDLSPKEKPHVSKQEIDFLTTEQAKAFLAALSQEPLFWQCLMTLLIYTGLRRGEAIGLQWGDIDGNALVITVCRSVSHKGKIGPLKGRREGESRNVPITPQILELLMKLKAEREAVFGQARPTDFVFCGSVTPTRPTYATNPTAWQSRFVKRHNLPDVSPHDLRHTTATLALEGGANLKQVQTLLGHKDPSTTMLFYAGISKEQQRKTVEGIAQLLDDHD